MGVSFVVGDSLLTADQLDNVAKSPQFDAFLGQPTIDDNFALDIDSSVKLTGRDLRAARESNDPSVPFEAIGVGKPLTVVLEQVYLGDYPDTMRWVPGKQNGDVLVTSASKSFQTFKESPRAVHLLKEEADRKSFLRATATTAGSQLVYYSPGVTENKLIFTFEMSVDREFEKTLGESLSKAVMAAGALPVFAPAAPYLIAAGAAIPLATAAVNLLARPTTYFAVTVDLNFNQPGMARVAPGGMLLYPDGHAAEFAKFKVDQNDQRLKDGKGNAYSGDLPYLIVSLDGTEQPQYAKWSAQAASAALTDRFFSGAGTLGAAIDVLNDALSLVNDIDNQKKALETKKLISETTDDKEKARLTALLEAYKKNIQNSDIKGTVK